MGIFASLLAMTVGCLSANAQSFVYVTNSGDNTVSVISTATNTVVATVPVGSGPSGVAITPNGAFAYVFNVNDNTVSVISTATNSVVATVPVGSGPSGVAITPNGAFAYVGNQNDNTASVINTATNAVVATVPVGPGANVVAIAPSGALAYVVNAQTVSVINTASNTVAATVSVPAGNGSTNGPGVAMTPNGQFLYVCGGEGNISVINTATNTVVATVSTTGGIRGSATAGVAITPNGAFGYAAVGGFNEVAIFDTSTNAVVNTIPVGNFPLGMAITPNGAFAYVANLNDNSVSVINTAANVVVATVPVGTKPFGLAITRFLDNDSQFSLLNGGNAFTGNQRINGNVSATNFVGNGAGLTGVAAATADKANFAINASQLGGIGAGNYARLDIGNTFTGNQFVTGNLIASGGLGSPAVLTGNLTAQSSVISNGPVTIGQSGTPIIEHLSQTPTITVPPVAPNNCATLTPVTFLGASDGDTIALGIKNALTSGGNLTYFVWVSATNTISIKVCNPHGTTNSSLTGMIRVDIWKH